jgi:hypothetical protein
MASTPNALRILIIWMPPFDEQSWLDLALALKTTGILPRIRAVKRGVEGLGHVARDPSGGCFLDVEYSLLGRKVHQSGNHPNPATEKPQWRHPAVSPCVTSEPVILSDAKVLIYLSQIGEEPDSSLRSE